MQHKRFKILHGSILFLLLILNIRIFLNRDNGYSYKEILNQKQLYTVKEDLQISRFNYNGNDSLIIFLNREETNTVWQITTDSNWPYNSSGNPKLKLLEGKHEYAIKKINDDHVSFKLGLNYVTEKTYQAVGKKRVSDVELLYSSLTLGDTQIKSKDFWKQASPLTTEREITDVKSSLKQIGVLSGESDISNIKKIANFILGELQSKQGTPGDVMDTLSPLKKMDYALKNKSKVWCGDLAEIFSLYANTAGITTRLVCTEGDANGIPKSGHSFNECYIPELNQWVFVDLTSGIVLVENKHGNYLNAIDFYNAHLLHSFDLNITKFENDSLCQTNYQANNSFYKDYFNRETYFVFYNATQFSKDLYSFKNKWQRYFLKHPTFSLYANSANTNNTLFYRKQALALSLIIFSIYLVALLLISRLNKKH